MADVKQFVPPDAGSTSRAAINEWAGLWNRTAHQIAPAYTRSWGHLLAGLMQAQPPTYQDLEDDAGYLVDLGTLAELTEHAVPVAAAFGAAYLRPVLVDDGWMLSVSKPTVTAATWSHQQMVEARVWDWVYDPRSTTRRQALVFVETWRQDGQVTAELWEAVKRDGGTVELGERIGVANHPDHDDSYTGGPKLAGHAYVQALEEHPEDERLLVPFVWKWDDGVPVPVFAGHEPAIHGLGRLWTQEQEDAEMARNRIAVAADSLLKEDVWSADGSRKIAQSGYNTDSNVLALSAGMSAQNPGEGGVQVITFPDSLVQRERIERRENGILEAIGINPQSVGRSVSGRSDSAAAKRADQQLTANTIAGPARRWQAALQLGVDQIHNLNGVGDVPVVKISEGMKPNLAERVEIVGAATAAEAMSTRTKLATIHPEWDAAAIDDELALMAGEGLLILADEPEIP